MLSKKYYFELAIIIANNYTENLEKEVILFLGKDNSRFDEKRFKAEIDRIRKK